MVNWDRIKVVDPTRDDRWDSYVHCHPEGSVYHLSAWMEVVESTYGYRPFYAALENSARRTMEGVLPLFLVRSILTGTRLVSLPFTSFTNPAMPDSAVRETVEFAMESNPAAKFILLKCDKPRVGLEQGFNKHGHFLTHILHLDGDEDHLMAKFHNSSVRQRIRRAERNKLGFSLSKDISGVKYFYRLHVSTRKKHGLPPVPLAFFENAWRSLRPRGMIEVPIVTHGDRIVSAAVVLKFKRTYHLEYSASDASCLKLCPNQKLIWECIKMALAQGCDRFDFGRSSASNHSLIEFKERWGATGYPLAYYSYPKSHPLSLEKGCGQRALETINRRLPQSLLRFQGKILYPHIG
jgi:hypothetical protein